MTVAFIQFFIQFYSTVSNSKNNRIFLMPSNGNFLFCCGELILLVFFREYKINNYDYILCYGVQ